MDEAIREALRGIEEQKACRVLFACESGSRAWGFASPDSDYDVRFVYVNEADWYLRLEQRPDTIEAMLPGELDVSGWDLGKTLKLFASCNLALNEWLGSPTVYLDADGFAQELACLIPDYFNPKKAAFHYLGMAARPMEKVLVPGPTGLKPLFYALRALLACRWVERCESMPPTAFRSLLQANLVPEPVRAVIEELLERKSRAAEGEAASAPAELVRWISETHADAQRFAERAPAERSPGWAPLNEIMRSRVLGS